MRILVTNDDGVESRGIIELADALCAIADVTVVAPDGDRSGIAHALSIHHPVRIRELTDRAVKTFSCSGTPADCVVVGAYELMDAPPDLVVSGINRGANAGDDITYSGTIAAANEALLIGVASIAVSLNVGWPRTVERPYWETAARVAVEAASERAEFEFPPTTLLNVNVPNLPYGELRGRRWTRQARKRYTDRTDRRTDPRGETYVWIWGSYDGAEFEEGTDLHALREGYASFTPLTIDRTDAATLRRRSQIADTR